MTKKVIKNNNKNDQQFNVIKFWRKIGARLAEMGKKRVWLSQVTPIKSSTINNWVSEKRWPTSIALYHFSKVFNTTMETLLEDSINGISNNNNTTTKK